MSKSLTFSYNVVSMIMVIMIINQDPFSQVGMGQSPTVPSHLSDEGKETLSLSGLSFHFLQLIFFFYDHYDLQARISSQRLLSTILRSVLRLR